MSKPTKGASAAPNAITVQFDSVERRRPFANTRAGGALAARSWTDRELLDDALRIRPDLTAEQLVHEGSLFFAREIVRKAKSPAARAAGNAPGAADKRMAAALKRILADNVVRRREGRRLRSITFATVAVEAKTNPETARRWLEKNPHLLPVDKS